jgi:hypothetical protein
MAKAKKTELKPDVTQANVKSIPVEIYEKFRTIAFEHGVTQNDLYNQALAKFIELYEKKNGPVQVGPKKKDIKL